MDPKPAIESKTIWANVIAIAITSLTAIAGQEWVKQYPWLVAAFPLILAALNIWLRFQTDTPVEVNPQPKPVDPPAVTDPTDDHPIIKKGLQWVLEALADGSITLADVQTKTTAELLDLIRKKWEARRAA